MHALQTTRRVFLAALLIAALPSLLLAQDTFTNVPRVVAVGDVHGGYQEFVTVLRQAGIIDEHNKWAGGKTHLVQTGDLVDRGAGSRKVMDLVMSLEKQAKSAGGRVHALVGNHEVMNITGDLRYVSPAEYEAFRTTASLELRDRAYRKLGDPSKLMDDAYRREWEAAHPLGWVEHRLAFGPKGDYGKWLRQHNTIVQINGMVFVHGGISPKYAGWSFADINKAVRAELDDPAAAASGLTKDREGPLWYRGLAQGTGSEIAAFITQFLAAHNATLIAVGHTNVAPAILPRLSGRIVLLDVGLLASYGGGPPACLLADGDKLFAIHRGTRLPLPVNGEDVVSYLESAARLDPQPSPLRRYIDGLASGGGAAPRAPRALPLPVAAAR